MKAHTVAQVVAAEAGGKSLKDRLSSMRDVVSAMVNRARITGQTLESVVSGRKQFDAYSKKMPAGTAAYVGLAEEAINDVLANGTTLPPDVTYYAQDYATKNLPKGLKAYKTAVDRHVYFSDPKNRAIVTAKGAVKPVGLPQTVNVAPRAAPSRIAPLGLQRPAIDITSNFPGMSIPADTASPRTMAKLGGIGAALSASPPAYSYADARVASAADNTAGVPSSTFDARAYGTPPGRVQQPDMAALAAASQSPLGLGQFTPSVQSALAAGPAQRAPAAQQDNRVASFTPTGPLTPDVYTPSTPSSVDPNAGFADPMQVAAAKEWGAKQAATVDPNTPQTYAQQQEDRAGWQATKEARKEQERQIAAAKPAPPEMAYAPEAAPEAATAAPLGLGATASLSPDMMAPSPEYAGLTPNMAQAMPAAEWSSKFGTIQAPALSPPAIAENVPVAPPVAVAPPPVQQVVQPVRQAVRRQIAVAQPNTVAPTMSGLTFGNITPGDRFSVGSINEAMGGARGATARSMSNPSVSYTSAGPNLGGFRRNEKFGFVQPVDASGATIGGIKYDDGKSAFSHMLGSIFGGSNKDNDKGGGRSSGRSSSSNRGRGSFGGSTHSSNSVT